MCYIYIYMYIYDTISTILYYTPTQYSNNSDTLGTKSARQDAVIDSARAGDDFISPCGVRSLPSSARESGSRALPTSQLQT